jgi:putative toxin-antitoxin system antitoxin component (TIGR02293 family)
MSYYLSSNEPEHSVMPTEFPEKPNFMALTHSLAPRPSTAMAHGRINTLEPMARITMIQEGVPADFVAKLAGRMRVSKDWIYAALQISPATIKRKVQSEERLSHEQSERLVGFVQLLDQVEEILARSAGNPTPDAAEWMVDWVTRPYAPLGGKRPFEIMDTGEGRTVVAGLLAQMESGAYA